MAGIWNSTCCGLSIEMCSYDMLGCGSCDYLIAECHCIFVLHPDLVLLDKRIGTCLQTGRPFAGNSGHCGR